MSSKTFAELFAIPLRNGLTKPKSVRGAGYKMVNMGELFANPRIDNISMDRVTLLPKEKESSMLEPGDLLFARQSLVRDGAGQCSIFVYDDEDVCFESHIIRCRLNKTIANPLFYYYFFKSRNGKQVIDAIIEQGAGAAGIRGSDLSKISVPYFNKPIQDVVAEQLKIIDDKIELNHHINQTFEQMTQAIFKSWFVDFEPVKAKIKAKAEGRDPERATMCAISGRSDAKLDQLPFDQLQQLAAVAVLFPEELEESGLGVIPRGWEIRKVEGLLSRLSSKVRYTKYQVKSYGITPVFEQGAGILLGYHDGSAQFAATKEDPAFIFGDHTCVTHLACEPFDISQNVIPLKGSDRPTIWVYYAVKDKQEFQEYRRHWMELVSKDSVVPTEPICQVFANIASTFHLALEANVRQNRELIALRDILLPKLLVGQISINTAS